MASKQGEGQQPLKAGLVLSTEDGELLERLAAFAERSSHEGSRAALIFMQHVFREAERRNERTGYSPG